MTYTRKKIKKKKLDMCPKDTDASFWCLEKNGTMIKVLAFSDNDRSIKADFYNIEKTNEGPCR